MALELIQAKATFELKEALRQVAFNNRTTTSKFIVSVIEQHPEIKKELKKQKALK